MLYREITDLKRNQKGLPASRQGREKQAGMALGIVLLVILILSVLGSLGVYRATQGVSQSRDFRIKSQSFYIAEAGVYRAVAELNDNINWTAGFNNVAYRNGAFTVTRTDPDVNRIQLTSVGVTSTVPAPNPITLRAIGLKVGAPPPMFEWAIFSSTNVTLDGNTKAVGGNIYSGGDLTVSTQNAVQGGSVSGYHNVSFASGNSSITNGNVFANNDVSLTNQNRVRVDSGSVYAGATVTGVSPFTSQVLGGAVNQNYSPAPVQPVSYYENNYKYTDADFANLMAQAQAQGNLHVGNYSPAPGNYTGIHYV